jgi:hypothetical protein
MKIDIRKYSMAKQKLGSTQLDVIVDHLLWLWGRKRLRVVPILGLYDTRVLLSDCLGGLEGIICVIQGQIGNRVGAFAVFVNSLSCWITSLFRPIVRNHVSADF